MGLGLKNEITEKRKKISKFLSNPLPIVAFEHPEAMIAGVIGGKTINEK
jgi:hypothetical protein